MPKITHVHPDRGRRNLRKLPPGLGTLQLLFKEVLQLMPAADADRLAHGYRAGKTIVLRLGVSAYGKGCKTAFASALTDDQSWRGMPEAKGQA